MYIFFFLYQSQKQGLLLPEVENVDVKMSMLLHTSSQLALNTWPVPEANLVVCCRTPTEHFAHNPMELYFIKYWGKVFSLTLVRGEHSRQEKKKKGIVDKVAHVDSTSGGRPSVHRH